MLYLIPREIPSQYTVFYPLLTDCRLPNNNQIPLKGKRPLPIVAFLYLKQNAISSYTGICSLPLEATCNSRPECNRAPVHFPSPPEKNSITPLKVCTVRKGYQIGPFPNSYSRLSLPSSLQNPLPGLVSLSQRPLTITIECTVLNTRTWIYFRSSITDVGPKEGLRKFNDPFTLIPRA